MPDQKWPEPHSPTYCSAMRYSMRSWFDGGGLCRWHLQVPCSVSFSQTRQQQKRHQQVLPLCGFGLRSVTCRQPLVPPADPLHTHHPQAVRAALVRKWVRKWVCKCARKHARKHARKPETCVCVVFRALPKICGGVCGGVCGAFWGSFLDSVCGHAVLALHTYGYANTFLRKHPSMKGFIAWVAIA